MVELRQTPRKKTEKSERERERVKRKGKLREMSLKAQGFKSL